MKRTILFCMAAGLVALSAVAGPALSTDMPLRALASARGILIGTAVANRPLEDDAIYRKVLTREFSIITPENDLKWVATQPAEVKFNFAAVDRIIDFATSNQLHIRGHTLCWNPDRYLPKWMLDREFTRAQAEALLREHIYTVLGRYRGRIKYWDVVNEAVANDNRPDAKPLFDGF